MLVLFFFPGLNAVLSLLPQLQIKHSIAAVELSQIKEKVSLVLLARVLILSLPSESSLSPHILSCVRATGVQKKKKKSIGLLETNWRF